MTNEELWKKLENKIELGLSNLTPNCQLYFEVHIVEHCNLDCKQCNHYSPLAEEEYISIDRYKKDCDRLSELFDGEMLYISLLGGEPLLHPQITEIMKITREAFPIGQVRIITNGLLLPNMPEVFWEVCKKYEVEIEATYYPIKFDYEGIKNTADSKGVKYTPWSAHTIQLKHPIIITRREGRALGRRNFLNCVSATRCLTLKNGKMYPCAIAAHIPHLKKYFNLDIHLSEKNGVDIYSVESGDELLEKIARPIPLCQYCDITDESIICDWGISKKDRYEWLAFEFTEDDIQYLKSKTSVVYVFGAGVMGNQTIARLKNEGITIKNVLTTRKEQCGGNILDVPIVTLDELGEVESNSICLVALGTPAHKAEVYPLLSQIGFGDVVPVSEIR